MGDHSASDSAYRAANDAAPSFDDLKDPDPEWVVADPDRALRFFFVSPRPCKGLDTLLGISAADD